MKVVEGKYSVLITQIKKVTMWGDGCVNQVDCSKHFTLYTFKKNHTLPGKHIVHIILICQSCFNRAGGKRKLLPQSMLSLKKKQKAITRIAMLWWNTMSNKIPHFRELMAYEDHLGLRNPPEFSQSSQGIVRGLRWDLTFSAPSCISQYHCCPAEITCALKYRFSVHLLTTSFFKKHKPSIKEAKISNLYLKYLQVPEISNFQTIQTMDVFFLILNIPYSIITLFSFLLSTLFSYFDKFLCVTCNIIFLCSLSSLPSSKGKCK